MDEGLVSELITEIRADYQIPPFLPRANIERSINKCAASLTQLNPLADYANDKVGRGLLKEYVHYDLYHRYEEFKKNYQDDILAWQLLQEVDDVSQ